MIAFILFKNKIFDITHRTVVAGKEFILRQIRIHFLYQSVLLEIELIADDGRIEGDIEISAPEKALERKGTGTGAGIPGGKNALGIEPCGDFHGFDEILYHLVHADGLFPMNLDRHPLQFCEFSGRCSKIRPVVRHAVHDA